MDRWKLPIIAGIVVIAAATMVARSGGADALSYRSDWGKTLTEARETGKPILLVFGGPW